ncbi:uncharacterized protein NEMAJ01_1993 [Nematocida major]|uniref:uncharacterized protein n=1 Tax=Nematocida major TaxID=1912982 RepID=UPI0020083548|nr:uncharacterized protein NEMAJ01_1993 [Nematocida major]KAH9387097.1 hypothetical protein NEMAJ01_1993 [Nematocida major]
MKHHIRLYNPAMRWLGSMKRAIVSVVLGFVVCMFVLWPIFLSFRNGANKSLRIKKGRPLAGCIPVKDGKLFMINGRAKKKFIFPKGGIEKGEVGYYTAGKEAIEEAGLIGRIDKKPAFVQDGVTWYVLEVQKVLSDWKEKHERIRVMIDPQSALVNSEVRAITKNVIKAFLNAESTRKTPRVKIASLAASDEASAQHEALPLGEEAS